MEKLNIQINYESYAFDELTLSDQELVNAAIHATNNAYANYSCFYVGAALRLGNNEIVIGANQENAAFPSGLCAERTAIFAAQAHYPDQPIQSIAIAARTAKGLLAQPIPPCGSCRQVMIEIENRYQQPISILLYGKERILKIMSVKDLLPLSFQDENMRV